MRIIPKRLARLLLAALATVALIPATPARAADETPGYTEATALCITDARGEVLYAYNEDEEMAPASLTKVVTAMVALDSGIPLDTPIDFVEVEFPEGAQLAGYREGDTPTFGELLKVTLIYSGNDAALNVAYAVAGTRQAFAELMNEKVAELGLTHSHFANPHGLEEEGHYTTAHDMCVIGRYALEHYPFIREAVHTPSVTIVADGHEVTLYSTDELMGYYPGLRGIKTGNTESGASFLGSARRGHVTLYSCALCCPSTQGRFDDTETVMDWAFSRYDSRGLADDDWVVRTAPWQDGFWLRCPVTASHDAVGQVLPDAKLNYTSVMLKPATLVGEHHVLGSTVWNQDGRLVESVRYRSGKGITADRAWSPLVQPAITSSARGW